MAVDRSCPRCGTESPAGGPAGLCPRCLLRLGTGADLSDARTDAGSSSRLPSVLTALDETVGPIPRVLLRDTGPETPVFKVESDAVPLASDLSGRYHLLGEIARGGMGAVLKGRDTDLGRDLAVKVLLDRHRGHPELVRRFVEEAQIGGQLQHPGIVPVYELGMFSDSRPFFAMKLVKGRTLAAILHARQDAEDEQARLLGIFEQVCQTVAYAHARGVIHRDLKPSNVIVGSFGEVQLMDWGLAKVLASGGMADEGSPARRDEESRVRTARSGSEADASQAGSVLGTPAYMAPEQARGEVGSVDERADVFSLGSILCELLTGRPAYTGPSGQEVLSRAKQADLSEAFARLERCTADAELVDLTRDCLAAVPGDRPRDAGVVAGRLSAHLQGVQRRLRDAELAGAQAQARAEEEERIRLLAEAKAAQERWLRRATTGLAASLLALVAVVGGGGAWWWQARTALVRDVEAALGEASAHRSAGRWPETRAAMERAEGRLGDAGPLALRERVRRARADDDLVAELEAIRLERSEFTQGLEFDEARADARYAAAFKAYGIDFEALGVEEAAARVRGSAVREALQTSLDAWLVRIPNPRRAKLVEVMDRADDDLWRRSLRLALSDRKSENLKVLAGRPEALSQPQALLHVLAEALGATKQPDAAISLLRQAQRRRPGDFWISYSLGSLLSSTRSAPRLAEAVGYLRAAVALRPETKAAHNALGIALHELREWGGAVAEYRKAIEIDPKDGIPHNNLGNALRDMGDRDAAIAEFRRAIELDPKGWLAHNGLGGALNDRGDRDGALAEFRKSIELNPKYATPHHAIGYDLIDRADWDGAEAEFRKAIELDPDYAEAHNGLGQVYFQRRDLDGAEAEFRKAVELDPRLAPPHSNVGAVLHMKGEPDRAIAEFRKAIELDPKHHDARTNLAHALDRKGDLDGAIAEYRKAVELDPKVSRVHDMLGRALRDKGDFDGALAEYRKAIELDPRNAAPRNNLAWMLAVWPDPRRRDPAAALEGARKAVELNPNHGGTQNTLGVAAYRAGDWNASLTALRKSMELSRGGYAGDWLFLAMVHWRLGRKDEARTWFDRADSWMGQNASKDPELLRFRSEAAGLLGAAKVGPRGNE
jgi:serine/threonine-protein kinase